MGDEQVVWEGVPGFVDRAYYTNFWHPMPRHAWADLSAAELLTAEVSTRSPLGWGPFAMTVCWHLPIRLLMLWSSHHGKRLLGRLLPKLKHVVRRWWPLTIVALQILSTIARLVGWQTLSILMILPMEFCGYLQMINDRQLFLPLPVTVQLSALQSRLLPKRIANFTSKYWLVKTRVL